MNNKEVSVVIRDDGALVCLDNDSTQCFKSIGNVKTQRASHVEPNQWPLRIAFHVLRYIFGDKGRMSEFTRYWPCTWRVNLTPVGGPVLPQRRKNRWMAIEDEVQWLNENLT